ncbi:hypothetical protein [Halostella litorea]|uniref:hypothetical protein n=1 Tax=Halostella litorea TaxID=2528831 RepID=UPI001091C281|nr:hypothetical protein [Halostella litorea]
MGDDVPTTDDVSEAEAAAAHEVELALEWLQRARGRFVEFHHATGHALDHLDDAEAALRDCGYDDLADEVRDEHLPRGVFEDRWTYDLLEEYEGAFLAPYEDFEERARERLAGGVRHVRERRQEAEWKERADR